MTGRRALHLADVLAEALKPRQIAASGAWRSRVGNPGAPRLHLMK
jgi:hypothetical protein